MEDRTSHCCSQLLLVPVVCKSCLPSADSLLLARYLPLLVLLSLLCYKVSLNEVHQLADTLTKFSLRKLVLYLPSLRWISDVRPIIPGST